MSNSTRIHTGAPWEQVVGYCRAVKRGPVVAVSGCAPVAQDGSTFAPGDHYLQAKRCLEIALKALKELGGGTQDVLRTRMFVTDIAQWKEYGRAHGECFGEHPPATSMVEVRKLIADDMLIEIELDAYIIEKS